MALMWMLMLLYIPLILITGYVSSFIKNLTTARLIGWLFIITTTVFSSAISWHQAPFVRMLVIVVLQLLSRKIIVYVESGFKLNPIQWIAFCLGWFGMRPALFEKFPGPSLPFTKILLKGVSRILVGILLLYFSMIIELRFQPEDYFIAQLFLLAGISLMLHFGILNIVTALWGSLGVNVTELFQAPYKSTSLKEFWGKRWNRAFSEMTALIAYRPLKNKLGAETSLILSFLLSGLLHEVAISLPVMKGFGLPMLYFVIHAIAMQLETRSIFVQKLLKQKWFEHVWVLSLLIIPMPLLFHRIFVEQVLVPLRSVVLHLLNVI